MVTTLHSNVAAISGTSVATRWMTSAVQIYSFTYLFLPSVAPDPKRWQNWIDLFICLFVRLFVCLLLSAAYDPEGRQKLDRFVYLFVYLSRLQQENKQHHYVKDKQEKQAKRRQQLTFTTMNSDLVDFHLRIILLFGS